MNKNEIINLIRELIERTTVGVEAISVAENDVAKGKDSEETIWIQAEVREPYFFLDRGGEGLSALNHVVRKIVEARVEAETPFNIMVDINGFQRKKIENLKAVAHMMAERARYFKSNIEIDPMSAFERRIIHEFLSDAADLKTESAGEGPNRRVVIKYIGGI
ncbi:hypothetical protein A3G06_00305 [Candidatus Nomurabacteria bacterium RIFCSPLOWO2_12_FULL_46_14]|uniref:R3H domain-containing protein n=1 Tax=Candidatus Nomurabacteria bacterium RIFCSPLOWO2_12_FULL_46_14 TaxID=1801797 RepID=A0A1F6Y8Z9_9BACT|nr:MAG: hypothetical protein A3G06_00305 [Candidatus Nomurabacteria bacterium RIFCSPLOWO2_12_FULL_46_14]